MRSYPLRARTSKIKMVLLSALLALVGLLSFNPMGATVSAEQAPQVQMIQSMPR